MEWDRVADELYALPPGEFTAARGEFAASAVKAGDKALARRIRALRKPPLAAWASNLLVRTRPDEARALLELGAALRQAHHDVDPDLLRKLSAQQRQLTAALARQAKALAEQQGHAIGEPVVHEVQAILHAALADPEAGDEWLSGRLSRTLFVTGFPVGTPAPARAKTDEPREVRGRLQEALQQARNEAGEAARAARDADKELASSERAVAQAEQRHDRAEQHAADLATRLEAAERDREEAAAAATRARDRRKFAERAAREAHTTAKTAAAQVDELTHRLRH